MNFYLVASIRLLCSWKDWEILASFHHDFNMNWKQLFCPKCWQAKLDYNRSTLTGGTNVWWTGKRFTQNPDVRWKFNFKMFRLPRNFFQDLYSNYTLNSEIRIASYLQAVRCPDYNFIRFIKDVLKNEKVNQVGSYVWSHLTNLAKSSSPVRVEVQGMLVDHDFGTKFKLDLRKFSRYFEHSLFFDEYNVGASTETNLIFGTDSYIPRSTSFNMTVDLFGESVNVMEMSAHLQGFEHMVESIFGPKGPLNTQGFLEKIDFILSYFREKISVEDCKLIWNHWFGNRLIDWLVITMLYDF